MAWHGQVQTFSDHHAFGNTFYNLLVPLPLPIYVNTMFYNFIYLLEKVDFRTDIHIVVTIHAYNVVLHHILPEISLRKMVRCSHYMQSMPS